MGVNGQGGKPWARGGARFLLYSHDGMGLGHLRRNLAVASALMAGAPDSAVLLVTGSGDAERLGLQRGMDILKLPALRKLGHGRYGARRLPIPSDELKALRAGMIAAAVRSFRPHVMLVDKHPAGAHAELRPALDELRASGGRAVVGFRDVLDDPEAVLREWRLGGDLQRPTGRSSRVAGSDGGGRMSGQRRIG